MYKCVCVMSYMNIFLLYSGYSISIQTLKKYAAMTITRVLDDNTEFNKTKQKSKQWKLLFCAFLSCFSLDAETDGEATSSQEQLVSYKVYIYLLITQMEISLAIKQNRSIIYVISNFTVRIFKIKIYIVNKK